MSTFTPQNYDEALASHKPLRRSQMARQRVSSCLGAGTREIAAGARKIARKKKAGRARLPSRKKLVQTLDTLTSQIVRLRDGQCVLCHTTEGLTCGHIFGRRSHGARFDIEYGGNCYVQCFSCNYRHNIDPWRYFGWYLDWYGRPAFDELYRRWSKGRKYSRIELIALVEEYKIKLEEMKSALESR